MASIFTAHLVLKVGADGTLKLRAPAKLGSHRAVSRGRPAINLESILRKWMESGKFGWIAVRELKLN